MFIPTLVQVLMLFIVLVFSLLAPPVSASAATHSIQSEPISSWKTVGKGRFKFAFWSIYDAELKSKSGDYNSANTAGQQLPLLLKLTYLRAIDKSDLVSNTFEQWQKQGLDVATLSQYQNVLNSLWPDVNEGDSLAIEVHPTHSQFLFNDKILGEPLSVEFGQVFIGIWLGNNTTEPELRNRLIGDKR